MTKPPRRRRVVVVEYDVTGLTPTEIDALLFCALASGRDVSFTVNVVAETPRSDLTPGGCL